VWGSFVTARPDPRDLDILLSMNEDFEVERIALGARFHWRGSLTDVARNIPDFQGLPKTQYRGIGANVIRTEDQMLLAQQCIANLRKVLLEARKVHLQ